MVKKRFFQFITWVRNISLTKKIIVLLVIIGLGWLLISRFFAPKRQAQYQTAEVTKRTIISTIAESGNISGNETSIASPSDGVIEQLYVKNGDTVTAGQNLFSVKSTATPAQQASAYASYLSAQSNLDTAKSKMNSLQSALFKANQAFVTDAGTANPDTADPKYIEENADWLQAEADYTNQQNVINQSQAALNSAALAYQETQDSVVTAPVSGTVANIAGGVGTSVSGSGSSSNTTGSNANSSSGTASSSQSSSSSTTSAGSAVMVIGDFSDLQMKVAVSEVDVPNIHAGQKATITVDAFPDKTFVGTVSSVDTIGTTSSGVVTYNAYITFAYTPDGIKPGMTASAVIQTQRKDDVLSIPTSGIQTSNGSSYVRVLKNGKITQVPVETGISSDTDTEITSGLSEGDTVVTSVVTPTTVTGSGGTSGSPFSGFGGGRGFGGGGGGVIFRGGGGRAGAGG